MSGPVDVLLIGFGVANATFAALWLRLLHRYRRICPVCGGGHGTGPVPEVAMHMPADAEMPPGLAELIRLRARLTLADGEQVTVDPVVRLHTLRGAAEMRFCLPESDTFAEIPAGASLDIGYIK